MSPHKFIGGPGASGILIAKTNLLKSNFPYKIGGGIVEMVDVNT